MGLACERPPGRRGRTAIALQTSSASHPTLPCQVQKSGAAGPDGVSSADDPVIRRHDRSIGRGRRDGRRHRPRRAVRAAARRVARRPGRGPRRDPYGRSRSRSELVARTGLGRAIVAQRVGELIERGLVSEGDVGPSTGGRPPRQLTFRADGGHILVADLGATSIDVAVTTLDGRILGHHDEPARIEAGPEQGLDRVDALFDSLLRTTPELHGRLWGIGIGVPGAGRVRVGPADLAADHARLGRLPDPRAVRRALRRPGLGRQRRQRPGPRGVALRDRRRPRRRGRGQDRDRASAPGSSRTGTCIAAPRGAPATSATSRSPTTRPSSAAAATSAASRRSPGERRSAGQARPRPRTGAAPGCGPRSISAGS